VTEAPSEKAPSVLVVVPDETLRGVIESSLRAGLPGVRLSATDVTTPAERLRRGDIDLLVLDPLALGLDPRRLEPFLGDGWRAANTHIILVGGDSHRVELLAAIGEGAGDCLFTPLQPEELVARARAGLRRVERLRRLAGRVVRSEELYSLQTEFLSTVSHEIRTPLSAIMSAANVLIRYGGERPESVERFARVIHEEGQRLTRLINNLLDLAKIESGEVEWQFAEQAVGQLAGRVRGTLASLARERDVTIAVQTADALPDIMLDGDRIVQVLVNLVSNAIKYAPEGSTVTLRALPRRGGGVRIEVEDEGPGVPAGMEERIFQRFQQLDVNDAHRGTGLGLAISREIVERHGGTVNAVPGRSRGALFVVELPAAPREAE
jgi:signal transduction histidine kinase